MSTQCQNTPILPSHAGLHTNEVCSSKDLGNMLVCRARMSVNGSFSRKKINFSWNTVGCCLSRSISLMLSMAFTNVYPTTKEDGKRTI